MANGNIVGPLNASTTASASGVWRMEEVLAAQKAGTWPGSLPVTTNLYAWYDAASFSGTTWSDKTTNARNASVSRGTVSKVSSAGANGASKTFSTLQGDTGAGITFYALPSTFTLFHVTRLTGGTRGRIFSGTGNNWLSGFWGGGTGVAYHEGWLTDQSDRHGNNWVLSTDQNSLYRSNGVTRGTGGGGVSTTLTLNAAGSEYSDWQCTEVIIYSGTLNSTEYAAVEAYLGSKYGITLG